MFKSLSAVYAIAFIFISAGTVFAAAGAADDTLVEEVPAFIHHQSNPLSTNWLNEVQRVLPSKYFDRGTPDFQQITNLLSRASRQGNNAALGLWGIALMAHAPSLAELNAGLQMLQTSAKNGYVPAMANLGVLYETGEYLPKNYDEAFHWFGLAATNGNTYAELELGACYHYGLGTTTNLAMAANCYRLAAEHTNYVGMKSYGYLLVNGIGVTPDVDTAKYWFTRAAKEGGNRRAMYNLGAIAALKFPDTNAMAEAFHWYQPSAELGDALACHALANCYYNGWGTSSNLDDYHLWLFKAATLGATDAQYRMGVACRIGDGVPRDIPAAIAWYEKAAAKNHPEACYDLAIFYLQDKSSEASLSRARRYMLQAAQGGNREAQFQTALTYWRGDVVPQDCDLGNQWILIAANNGWAEAEFALFQIYYNGIMPGPNCAPYPKDKTEALKWLRRAADHGNFQAQSTLGVMLIQGTEIDPDVAAAEKLLRNAAQHGYAQAQNDLGYAILQGALGSTDWVEAAMWCQLAEAHWNNPKTQSIVETNVRNALSRLTPDQLPEVQQRVASFHALPVPELDPLVKDWDKNPAYQQEDGRYGH